MAASRKTVRNVAQTIERWRSNNGVSTGAMLELFLMLTTIDGNKSFRRTISEVRENWSGSVLGK